MNFSELVHERRSVSDYDPDAPISDSALRAIFEDVRLSPSASNLQHWRFVVVRDPDRKTELQAAAYNQAKVGTCSAAIVACGKLDALDDAPRIYQSVPSEAREGMISRVHAFYDGKEQLLRDEAIRSATLAAMTLMFSAKSHGFDTGPMIGFDPQAVRDLIHLPDNLIPVMLITLGRQSGESRPRADRLPIDEIVRCTTFDGQRLHA